MPTLAELLDWPTDHLTEAASHWTATAERWYEVFDRVWRDSLSADWNGAAAEQLRTRTHADKLKVGDLDDQLREAARVARMGASELFAARSRVRHTVDGAHAAGFEVGEHLSVAYYSARGNGAEAAALHALAEQLADDIHQHARQLVGLDQQVAGKISAALAGIDSVTFDKGSAAPRLGSANNGISRHPTRRLEAIARPDASTWADRSRSP